MLTLSETNRLKRYKKRYKKTSKHNLSRYWLLSGLCLGLVPTAALCEEVALAQDSSETEKSEGMSLQDDEIQEDKSSRHGLHDGKGPHHRGNHKKSHADSSSSDENYVSIRDLIVSADRPKATTDGSGSYVVKGVTIGKRIQRLEDIPQSVSVMTKQQMLDQNLNTVSQALTQMPGVNVNNYGDGTSGVTARGYGMNTQYDSIPSFGGLSFAQQFDLSIYDRIETIRGPDGIFQGGGSPGGSVNFVHKRPLDKFHVATSGSVGSWNNLHADFDVTGPLNKAGTINGRIVMAGASRDYFYKPGHDQRWTGYGAIDFHFDEKTTLTLMATGQKNTTTRFMGLPRGSDGSDLHLPVSTYIGAGWNKTRSPMYELAADFERHLDKGWLVRLAGRHRQTNNSQQYSYLNKFNSATMKGNFALAKAIDKETYDDVDLYVTGPVHLFNRKHIFLVGANYSYNVEKDAGSSVSSSKYPQLADQDIFAPILSSSLLPETLSPYYREPSIQKGMYASAQIEVIKPVQVLLGGRWSSYEYKYRNLTTGSAYVHSQHVANQLTPYAGVVWHMTPSLTSYFSFTDIFAPQGGYTESGERIKPIQGQQMEVGIKGAWFHEKLHASFAAYRVMERNRAQATQDGRIDCGLNGTSTCYEAAGLVRSQGFDTEIIGRPIKGLDINMGYTYNDNRVLKGGGSLVKGIRFTSNSPAHLFKLWSHYRFALGSSSDKNILSFGGGVNAQSSTFGNSRLVTQPSYVIASAQVGYQLDPKFEISVTVSNLSNARYYTRLGTLNYYNYYGDPRSFMFSVHSAL
ncbi:MAG: TonB-dependent siderophore receptor [Zymomonas mobilis subsp. pomaceae]|uniref:TonB-dependent siderophore receptor n=1 Tax=Zymomonas mobilis subsp. pomaceae (strain ATCC 29192 / DSM 22645 / JCM 10191 / CCUG 17912 / NBRC 13757 / NCIMB 11200 / NRRL B-4491 / Barker I) TaxID=579138 RepID=F8ESX6_ZYMMT|nr:TonB-dependent siderophore receptor [Zymomonas mobilis]AEI37880.1 TonB-dependent siderophore receptor [Zymomonas mobilis subsp. pomaceae ATCC 29192]MDX5949246.1 TonB-dependent siderophore receptor [Zymomonas mobilis subsp. pomaceae]GEB89524.1 ligand-gated channel [Zymomonas mobilis subsp. pomaceae]